jgi:hypothetical protein
MPSLGIAVLVRVVIRFVRLVVSFVLDVKIAIVLRWHSPVPRHGSQCP